MGFIIEKHICWDNFLNQSWVNPELSKIESLIGKDYFPKNENVFRFMKNDLDNVKYIIVGMEPYPSSYVEDNVTIPEATGRSFEVSSLKGKSWSDKFKQTSLRNIVKTIYYNETGEIIKLQDLREKIENKEFLVSNPTKWFDNTEKQGVIWLNATLTVKPYDVDSHRKYWDKFMTELIKYINDYNKDIIWVLWGNPAKERVLPIVGMERCICTVHPRIASFVNENCFAKMDKVNWVC